MRAVLLVFLVLLALGLIFGRELLIAISIACTLARIALSQWRAHQIRKGTWS